jgi:hypothetical protein
VMMMMMMIIIIIIIIIIICFPYNSMRLEVYILCILTDPCAFTVYERFISFDGL